MLSSSPRSLFRLTGSLAKFATISPSSAAVSHFRHLSTPPAPTPPQSDSSKAANPPKTEVPADAINLSDKSSPVALLPTPASSTVSSQPDKLYKTLELEVLAYEPSVLDSYQWFVMSSARHLSIPLGKVWSPLKSDKDRFPLLKSAFVHKKHQVHYEIRTYHRFITLHHLTSSTADTFLEYIQRNLPEGCGLKVTRVEVQPLPNFLAKTH